MRNNGAHQKKTMQEPVSSVEFYSSTTIIIPSYTTKEIFTKSKKKKVENISL